MMAVSDEFNLEKPVLGGSSMGSASALYAALHNVNSIIFFQDNNI